MISPSPFEIKEKRKELKLTVAQCSRIVDVSKRAWQYYEKGERKMSGLMWEYFLGKINERKSEYN